MSYLQQVDNYLDSLKEGFSPIVDSWFLMSSPGPILSIVVMYLLWVRVGPKIMRNRPPIRLEKPIMYYNAIQVLMSLLICYKAFNLNLFRDGLFYAGCRYPSKTTSLTLLDLGWWYAFAKVTDLLDTVFFVLRKKNNQVTFLHVYHHATMAFYAWSYLKYAAGGQGAILALLNSFVHVVMYSYYFLSGLGPKYQKYLWWKKYVTTIQLIQFVIMLTILLWTYFSPRCQFATNYTYVISFNVSIFLALFLNFYVKSYTTKSVGDQKKKDVFEQSSVDFNKIELSEKNNGVHNNNEEVKNSDCIRNGKTSHRGAKITCESNGLIQK